MSRAVFELPSVEVDLQAMTERKVLDMIGSLLDAAVSPDCAVPFDKIARAVVDTCDRSSDFRYELITELLSRFTDEVVDAVNGMEERR